MLVSAEEGEKKLIDGGVPNKPLRGHFRFADDITNHSFIDQ